MKIASDPSYSRLPKEIASKLRSDQPRATRGQKVTELILFVFFGLTIALAAVALYATNRPEHRRVPNHFASGVAADRVNVLLIGVSLRADDTPTASRIRTESLMLLSVQPSTGRAVLMSIPVDLWVKIGRYGERPLRMAQTVGDASGYPGAGTGLTVDTVSAIVGQPVHAYARVSIGDIRRIVDAMGGVEVDVHRGIFDYRNEYRFTRGTHRLSGLQAMQYGYARTVAGFARERFQYERRQQELILAVLQKLTGSTGTNIHNVFGEMAATNLRRHELALLGQALRGATIERVSFEPYLDKIDVSTVAYRGEALQPPGGDFAALRQIAGAAFEAGVARVH